MAERSEAEAVVRHGATEKLAGGEVGSTSRPALRRQGEDVLHAAVPRRGASAASTARRTVTEGDVHARVRRDVAPGRGGRGRDGRRLGKDRQAILAMAGKYKVEFNFMETVALAKGYAAKPPKRSGATELVLVIEDTPRRIELQHILVMGDPATVVKHWRQRWDYEDADLVEFQGHATWAHRRLGPAEAKGTWTQSVFEVDDAPRYEGVGRWVHAGDSSSWESNETWRPLPRREYTTRDDYQVLLGRNRHTVTPAGWVHEQDNVKVRLDPSRELLVREAGLNRYTRVDKDLAAGEAYWKETRGLLARGARGLGPAPRGALGRGRVLARRDAALRALPGARGGGPRGQAAGRPCRPARRDRERARVLRAAEGDGRPERRERPLAESLVSAAAGRSRPSPCRPARRGARPSRAASAPAGAS